MLVFKRINKLIYHNLVQSGGIGFLNQKEQIQHLTYGHPKNLKQLTISTLQTQISSCPLVN